MFSWQDSWKFASTICFPGSFYPNKLNLLVQAQDISRLFTSLMSLFFKYKNKCYTDSYKTSFCTATVMRKTKKEQSSTAGIVCLQIKLKLKLNLKQILISLLYCYTSTVLNCNNKTTQCRQLNM